MKDTVPHTIHYILYESEKKMALTLFTDHTRGHSIGPIIYINVSNVVSSWALTSPSS